MGKAHKPEVGRSASPDEHGGAGSLPAIQLRQSLAGLPYAEQVQRLRPPMPLGAALGGDGRQLVQRQTGPDEGEEEETEAAPGHDAELNPILEGVLEYVTEVDALNYMWRVSFPTERVRPFRREEIHGAALARLAAYLFSNVDATAAIDETVALVESGEIWVRCDLPEQMADVRGDEVSIWFEPTMIERTRQALDAEYSEAAQDDLEHFRWAAFVELGLAMASRDFDYLTPHFDQEDLEERGISNNTIAVALQDPDCRAQMAWAAVEAMEDHEAIETLRERFEEAAEVRSGQSSTYPARFSARHTHCLTEVTIWATWVSVGGGSGTKRVGESGPGARSSCAHGHVGEGQELAVGGCLGSTEKTESRSTRRLAIKDIGSQRFVSVASVTPFSPCFSCTSYVQASTRQSADRAQIGRAPGWAVLLDKDPIEGKTVKMWVQIER